jgi:endonuclease III
MKGLRRGLVSRVSRMASRLRELKGVGHVEADVVLKGVLCVEC